MDPLIAMSTFQRDNDCFLETQSRKKETTINKIYIDPKDKRFKEAITLAKNLFIKRTRTLYNWLYPSVTRKQINQLVLKTWENLPNEEKNKEIIQVLNDKHPQQLKAQVNPQVFDLFQGHITTPENDVEVSDLAREQFGAAVVVATTATETAASLTFLNDASDTRITTIAASGDEPDTLGGKRSRYDNEHDSTDAIYSYLNENRKRIKLDRTSDEFADADMFDDFANDPELNKEFQEFATNVDQTYMKL